MKRWLTVLAILFAATGCGANNAGANNTTNSTSPANTVVSGSQNDSGQNSTSSQSDSDQLDNTQMNKIAAKLVEQYAVSHNDKTLAQYKKDLYKTFVNGFADMIYPAAASGIDYNHPLQSHSIQIVSTTMQKGGVFNAMVTMNMHYKGESPKNLSYIFEIVEQNGQWYIAKIT